ncbi:AAA family ATPase [Paracoccus chinensis]|uniref:RecA-family ATPase n=1 Tax=Paracoccus chinensis TaxID=525640 RepID=A0A1G9HAF4_9RHOB|nr:AAA family ATPase [Paracoccus chinensis]SDL09443.1 RecA-family ATPase [Paracoccus chinensis]
MADDDKRDRPEDTDTTPWAEMAGGPTVVNFAAEKAKRTDRNARKSRFFSAAELDGREVPVRDWLVPGMIPSGTVTLLSGDGGTGKSLLALQLAVACALGRPWIGRQVAGGTALYVSAEDDEAELHRRLAGILQAGGADFLDLDQLSLRSLAGEDALLTALDARTGHQRITDLFRELDAFLTDLRPALVVLDTLADLFPGNENDRAQARQFIGLLRGIAIRHSCAVVLLAHPSLSGIQSGTGMSGSTGWHNSVRSRLYLHRVIQGDEEPNPDARVLQTMKANYGPTGEEISLTWRDGVFSVDPTESGLDRLARRSKATRKFMELLRLLRQQGRDVNSRSGPNYAPSVFAAHPDSEGITKAAFREAMEILFAQNTIRNVQITRDRKPTTVLQEAE